MSEIKYQFNSMFDKPGSNSGLLKNNIYLDNLQRAQMLNNGGMSNSTGTNQGLINNNPSITNTQNNYAQPELQKRSILDHLLNRENPENVRRKEERNRQILNDYMYSLDPKNQILFALDPQGFIDEAQSHAFDEKDPNREGLINGRRYLKRNDNYYYYVDGDQERVFKGDINNQDDDHATTKLYNEYKKFSDPNKATYNPQLASILLRQLEAIGSQDGSFVTIVKDESGRVIDVTMDTGKLNTNTSDNGMGGWGVVHMTGDGGATLLPADITSYYQDPKNIREIGNQDMEYGDKMLRMNRIYDNIEEIGIDKVTGSPDALKRVFTSNILKWGGIETTMLSPEQKKEYAKATETIALITGDLNRYIKEITGAQMSEKEVIRLKQALANVGVTGNLGQVFGDGDDPIAFMVKLDITMRHIQDSRARREFYRNNAKILPVLNERYGLNIDQKTMQKGFINDIYMMTNPDNRVQDVTTIKDMDLVSGKIVDRQLVYGLNGDFFMDGERMREILNTVQKRETQLLAKDYAEANGYANYNAFMEVAKSEPWTPWDQLTDEQKAYRELEAQAVITRNKLFGLSEGNMTFQQRNKFGETETYKNKSPNETGFFEWKNLDLGGN